MSEQERFDAWWARTGRTSRMERSDCFWAWKAAVAAERERDDVRFRSWKKAVARIATKNERERCAAHVRSHMKPPRQERPTIAELEQILAGDNSVEILPSGDVVTTTVLDVILNNILNPTEPRIDRCPRCRSDHVGYFGPLCLDSTDSWHDAERASNPPEPPVKE